MTLTELLKAVYTTQRVVLWHPTISKKPATAWEWLHSTLNTDNWEVITVGCYVDKDSTVRTKLIVDITPIAEE